MTGRARLPAGVVSAMEVARFCEVDLKTIHNWANRGKIPYSRTRGRHLRFRRLDVIDFLRDYGFPVPDRLRNARPRVVAVDADRSAIAAIERGLSRRFEIATFTDVVDALLRLALCDADALVLGDVRPLHAPRLAERIGASPATCHLRLVAVGQAVEGVAASVARLDVAELRDKLEWVTGLQ